MGEASGCDSEGTWSVALLDGLLDPPRPARRATTQSARRTDQKAAGQTPPHIKGEPTPQGVKKLAGGVALYRIREGDYRIIYTIRDKELIVLVVKIGDRKEIYR